MFTVTSLRHPFLQDVAVKLESQKARHPQLLYESKLYKILQGGNGIPKFRYGTVKSLLISPCSINLKSNVQVMRIIEMISNSRS